MSNLTKISHNPSQDFSTCPSVLENSQLLLYVSNLVFVRALLEFYQCFHGSSQTQVHIHHQQGWELMLTSQVKGHALDHRLRTEAQIAPV